MLANRTADFEKGVESHFSVVHMEDKLYFLSRLGVCWWQGDSSAKLISYKIDTLFRPEVLNLAALGTVYAYQYNDRCGWALPEAGFTSPTMVIEYYPRYGPIYQISGSIGPGPWMFQRPPATCFTTYRYGSVERVYGGAAAANKMYWVYGDIGTDDGAMYSSLAESAFFDLGEAIFWKYLRRLKAVGKGKFFLQMRRNFQTALYQTMPINFSLSQNNWNTGNWTDPGAPWGPDSYIKEIIIDTDMFGRSFSLVFTDSETATGILRLPVGSKDHDIVTGEWSIYEVIFDGELLGLRG